MTPEKLLLPVRHPGPVLSNRPRGEMRRSREVSSVSAHVPVLAVPTPR